MGAVIVKVLYLSFRTIVIFNDCFLGELSLAKNLKMLYKGGWEGVLGGGWGGAGGAGWVAGVGVGGVGGWEGTQPCFKICVPQVKKM